MVIHTGGCHCGAVRFEFDGPEDIIAWDCNCSICKMKKNTHTIVPKDKFRILAGKESLTDYQFGSKTAHHYFCRVCGIHSFYIPRSNPDGFAVTIYCINPGTVRTVTVNEFDGENWEHSFSGSTISKLSKD